MSFSHTCVSPRYLDVRRTARRSDTGGKAFKREDVDPRYVDVDGFWLKDADIKARESATIAKQRHAHYVIGGPPGFDSDSGFEPASVMLQSIYRRKSS